MIAQVASIASAELSGPVVESLGVFALRPI